MNKEHLLQLLNERCALITNSHIAHGNGEHGPAYVNRSALMISPTTVRELAEALALPFLNEGIEAVAGVVINSAILANRVAEVLETRLNKHVASLYAEESAQFHGYVLNGGYDGVVKGKRVLIAQDVLSTDTAVLGVIDEVRRRGGVVAGITTICSRVTINSVPRVEYLFQVPLDRYAEADCPLCKAGMPIDNRVCAGRRNTRQ